MKYFIPFANDMDQAKKLREGIIKFCEEQTGWKVTDRKIYRLKYKHDGNIYLAVVGEEEEKNGINEGEIVIAILESNVTYFVCTKNRGVVRGTPILVGKNDVISFEDFD